MFQWDDWTEIADGCFLGFNVNECPATIIGVALDGFPIYSPQNCSCDVANVQSDGSCSEWPSTPWDTFTSSDLDDCHGREIDNTQSSDENAEHIYEYRLSLDAPYHIGCLMGEKATMNKCEQDSKKRSDKVLEEMIAMKALKEGAAEHLMELNEILEKAAREVEKEEEKREEEEKRREEDERKREEQEEQARRVNKLRSLLAELMGLNKK